VCSLNELATILNLLVLLGLGVAVLFGKNYFPKYLGEKAKNLATKEDITEITNKIEAIKSDYAHSLENTKTQLQVEAALREAFQAKCLETIIAINDLLVEITLYCWKEIAKRSPNEHYVWDAVDSSDESKGFHYYRVAIDKASLTYGLYLTENAKKYLSDLSNQIGLLSSMELALTDDDPHPAIEESAESGYTTGLNAVEECRLLLMKELGLSLSDETSS